MSKTLKYLPDGQDFSDHHFTRSEAFRPTNQAPKVHGGNFAHGGHVEPGCYADGGKVTARKGYAMGGGPPVPMAGPPAPPMGGGLGLGAPPPPAAAPMSAPRPHRPSRPKAKAAPVGKVIGKQINRAMAKRLAGKAPAKRRAPRVAPPAPPAMMGAPGAGAMPPSPLAAPAPVPAKKGGHITAAKRHSLPASDFVFPGKEAYPVDTRGRAKAALSRGAHNASPGQLAKIKAKVKAKYPSMDVKAKGGQVHGGRYAEGGHVESMERSEDEASDRAMVTSGVHQHEKAMHKGHKETRLKLARGGHLRRYDDGGAVASDDADSDDYQKGVPYAKADPYTGPANAAMRVSKITVDKAGNRTGQVTGGLQGVRTKPISMAEFNKKARGGNVRKYAEGGPVNRMPHDPRDKPSDRNLTPGGQMPYGVQPDNRHAVPRTQVLRRGGMVKPARRVGGVPVQ